MLLILLALMRPVFAQTDFAEEAHARMKLSFDLDAAEAMIDAPLPQQARVAALPLTPNSEVEAVTVFRDRALVTRVLAQKLVAGPASLTFEGLPPGLDPGSLHASVGAGEATIEGVELVSGIDLARDTARREALRARMRPIATELGEVRDRIEALLARRAYLRSTLLTPPSGDRPLPSLATVRETGDYLGETERSIAARLRVEEEKAQELGEDLAPLLVELQDPLATGQHVRVDLSLPHAGAVSVGLRYQVSGAGWAPAYRARLDPEEGTVALELVAVISQATGETWDSAELSLSSAAPWISGDMPTLTPWLLEDGGGIESGGGLVTGDGGASGAGATVYTVSGRRDIAGDGSAQRIPLSTRSFPAQIERATVPRAVAQVHQAARFTYVGERPLLPGPVAAYVGADYVGASSLGTVVPGEQVELGFGADERLRVSRLLVSRNREGAGVGRRNNRWTFHYQITVKNLAAVARDVEVRDQIPVSADEKVSVKILQASGIEDALAADPQGIARWSLHLAPGEERAVDLEFSVTAPVVSEVGRAMEYLME